MMCFLDKPLSVSALRIMNANVREDMESENLSRWIHTKCNQFNLYWVSACCNIVNKQLILNNLYFKHNIFILLLYYASLFPPLNEKLKIAMFYLTILTLFLAFASLFPTILTFLLTTVFFFFTILSFLVRNCELISCNSDFTRNQKKSELWNVNTIWRRNVRVVRYNIFTFLFYLVPENGSQLTFG